jgi:hypothetical protein
MPQEMTIDEAIRDCIAQVPETCPYGFKWYEDQSPRAVMPLRGWRDTSLRQPPGVIHTIKPEYFRSLWFDAAWEWLVNTEAHFDCPFEFHRPDPDEGWQLGRYPCDANSQPFEFEGDYPTKYHALRAAVLLAKGLKP